VLTVTGTKHVAIRYLPFTFAIIMPFTHFYVRLNRICVIVIAVKVKVKVHPITCPEGPRGGVEV
jgi:hypothetical protein